MPARRDPTRISMNEDKLAELAENNFEPISMQDARIILKRIGKFLGVLVKYQKREGLIYAAGEKRYGACVESFELVSDGEDVRGLRFIFHQGYELHKGDVRLMRDVKDCLKRAA